MRPLRESMSRTPRSRGPFAPAALCVLLVAACAPAVVPAEVESPLTLRVLHTNDVHGRLLPQEVDGRPAGGSAVLAAHFDSARVRAEGPTVLVDGGDVMQGTAISNLSWGRATIDVFNALGYDGVAVGNHEFDWGIDTLPGPDRREHLPLAGGQPLRGGHGRAPRVGAAVGDGGA